MTHKRELLESGLATEVKRAVRCLNQASPFTRWGRSNCKVARLRCRPPPVYGTLAWSIQANVVGCTYRLATEAEVLTWVSPMRRASLKARDKLGNGVTNYNSTPHDGVILGCAISLASSRLYQVNWKLPAKNPIVAPVILRNTDRS